MKGKYKIARKHWCDKCDRNHVGPGEKCSVCGYKDPANKNPKPTSSELINLFNKGKIE